MKTLMFFSQWQSFRLRCSLLRPDPSSEACPRRRPRRSEAAPQRPRLPLPASSRSPNTLSSAATLLQLHRHPTTPLPMAPTLITPTRCSGSGSRTQNLYMPRGMCISEAWRRGCLVTRLSSLLRVLSLFPPMAHLPCTRREVEI